MGCVFFFWVQFGFIRTFFGLSNNLLGIMNAVYIITWSDGIHSLVDLYYHQIRAGYH